MMTSSSNKNDQVEDEIVTAGSMQNASLLNALEDKFASLQGQKSDYLKTLSPSEKQVLLALKNLNKKNDELEREKYRQIHEVEKKFQVQHDALNKSRRELISGDSKPTAEQIARTEDEAFQDVEEMGEIGTPSEKDIKGIPEFWLTCLKNLPPLQDLITEPDEACLKHLVDIRVVYLETNPGFTLEFEFEENEYFTNKVLTKSYYLNDERIELVYDHALGYKILIDLDVILIGKKTGISISSFKLKNNVTSLPTRPGLSKCLFLMILFLVFLILLRQWMMMKILMRMW